MCHLRGCTCWNCLSAAYTSGPICLIQGTKGASQLRPCSLPFLREFSPTNSPPICTITQLSQACRRFSTKKQSKPLCTVASCCRSATHPACQISVLIFSCSRTRLVTKVFLTAWGSGWCQRLTVCLGHPSAVTRWVGPLLSLGPERKGGANVVGWGGVGALPHSLSTHRDSFCTLHGHTRELQQYFRQNSMTSLPAAALQYWFILIFNPTYRCALSIEALGYR